MRYLHMLAVLIALGGPGPANAQTARPGMISPSFNGCNAILGPKSRSMVKILISEAIFRGLLALMGGSPDRSVTEVAEEVRNRTELDSTFVCKLSINVSDKNGRPIKVCQWNVMLKVTKLVGRDVPMVDWTQTKKPTIIDNCAP